MNKSLRLEMILKAQSRIYELDGGQVCLLGVFQGQHIADVVACKGLAEEFVVNTWVDRGYVLEKLRLAVERSHE